MPLRSRVALVGYDSFVTFLARAREDCVSWHLGLSQGGTNRERAEHAKPTRRRRHRLCGRGGLPLAIPHGKAATLRLTRPEWGITGVPGTVEAGTTLAISVTNHGRVVHELVLEKGDCAKQCVVKLAGHNAELENLAPGMTKSAVWTIVKPGRYTFNSRRKPGHWNAGIT